MTIALIDRLVYHSHLLIFDGESRRVKGAYVLKEARTSSEIESIVTTQDEPCRALAADDRQVSPETNEVPNYRSAVWARYRLLRDTRSMRAKTAPEREWTGT